MRTESRTQESGAAGKVHNLLADIEDLIGQSTSLSGADLDRLTEQLGQRITAALREVEEPGGSIDRRERKTATDTSAYVNGQPWTAVGIGAGIGFMLGLALARRA